MIEFNDDDDTASSDETGDQPEDGVQQTVFLVDDDDALRKSLKFMLESCQMNVKAYPNAAEFLEELDTQADGCAIIDIRMPDMDGVELQQLLIQKNVFFPIIILTANAEVPKVVEMMKNGAHHLMLKSASNEEIVDRVKQALEYSKEIHRKNRESIHTSKLINSLTRREAEVMSYVIEGLLNREIAEKMNVKLRTVEAHRGSVMKKMEASNAAELIHKVIEYRRHEQ